MNTSTVKALGLRLLTEFFSQEQLANGNCTPAAGRDVLNKEILGGIRGKPCVRKNRLDLAYYFSVLLCSTHSVEISCNRGGGEKEMAPAAHWAI